LASVSGVNQITQMSPALGQVVTLVSSVDLGKTKIFIIEMVHKSRRPNGATGDRGPRAPLVLSLSM
jgi:hypothetical protein